MLAQLNGDQGFEADARRIWLRLATSAQDPLARIRAYDAVISSAARAGDFARAWSHWQECRSRLAGTALEATELGERVRDLGAEPSATIPAWLAQHNAAILDRDGSDLARLEMLVARFGEVEAAVAPLERIAEEVTDDQLTRELLRTIAAEETLT